MTEMDVNEWVINFTLVLTRVSALIVSFPLFGQRYLPRTVKAGLCFTLTLVWLPEVVQHAPSMRDASWMLFTIRMVAEMLIGTFIGYTFGLVLLPTRVAGAYLSQEMGFSLGQITDPASSSSTTELGAIFDAFGVLILLALNVHHTVLQTLHASFRIGLDRRFVDRAWLQFSMAMSHMLDEGLLLIAPLATCLFITLFLLSVMMRSWPQLNLFSFGIPVRFIVGLGAMFLLAPYILSRLEWLLRSTKRSKSALRQLVVHGWSHGGFRADQVRSPNTSP